ncbi:MAG: glycosyltransferase [Streptosporangiales bacterium]|nr:glycosyltransferase [Streptosporangiales bacterium]
MSSPRVTTLRRPRIALYSHDAVGLGHIRRNIAIAGALRRLNPAPDVLLITGTPEAAALARPDGCDVLGLPALTKTSTGGYGARHLSLSLGELIGMRAEMVHSALSAFRPDLLVVDKHPRGFRGELTPTLDTLTARGATKVVLGLRDVLDEPARARREWADNRSTEAVSRWYDQVWLYGDPRVHDLTATLRLPGSVAALATYTGYLADRPMPEERAGGRYVLGLVGAGGDGGPLAEAFAGAAMPPGYGGVLITGPHLPPPRRSTIRDRAAARADLQVHDFVPDMVPWLDQAAAVVAMGGYNTVCEALVRRLPTLVVPRVRPRAEQLVRASGLAATGAVDALHPDDLSTARVGDWLATAVRWPARDVGQVDLDGLRRLPALAEQLLHGGATCAEDEDVA